VGTKRSTKQNAFKNRSNRKFANAQPHQQHRQLGDVESSSAMWPMTANLGTHRFVLVQKLTEGTEEKDSTIRREQIELSGQSRGGSICLAL
jgi:hypothetical protein